MFAIQTNPDEWLEMRRGKIGASDAPVILEMSPWTTPYQLWEEKLKLRPDRKSTGRMTRGKELEPIALDEFEKLTGLTMLPQMGYQHESIDWMMATLDGITPDGKHIVEIKCPGKDDHACALDGEVPSKYMPQLQHQLEVTGLDKAFYFSFDGQSGKVIEIYRNQKYIDDLLTKEQKFWDCVQTLSAPPITDRDYAQKCDDLWANAASDWIACHSQLEALKEREEELRDTLIGLSGNQNSMGSGVRLTRVIRRGNVDYKAIPELKNVDVEAYRKGTVQSWRLTIK